jgi:AcrR family transcriptional regulator
MAGDASGRDRAGRSSHPPQQVRSRATRARILRTSSALIAKQGYERTSMAEIAAEAGVGAGTLYRYFPDKRALLLELVDQWCDQLANEHRSDPELERIFAAAPRDVVAGVLRRVHGRLQHGNWLYAEIFRLLPRDAEVRHRYQQLKQAGAEHLAKLFEFGQQRGLLRRAPDPTAAAFLMIHTIELLAGHMLALRRPLSDVDRILGEATDMLCRYLAEDA